MLHLQENKIPAISGNVDNFNRLLVTPLSTSLNFHFSYHFTFISGCFDFLNCEFWTFDLVLIPRDVSRNSQAHPPVCSWLSIDGGPQTLPLGHDPALQQQPREQKVRFRTQNSAIGLITGMFLYS